MAIEVLNDTRRLRAIARQRVSTKRNRKQNRVRFRAFLLPVMFTIFSAFVSVRLAYAQNDGVDVGSGEAGDAKPLSPFFRGPESVIANLLDRKGLLRVARVNLQILVKNPEINHPRLREIWPEITQEIGFIMASFRVEDLKDRNAMERLRLDIKQSVENVFNKTYKDKNSIEDVFFEELVAQ